MKKKKFNAYEDDYKLIDDTTPFAIKEAFNHLRTNLTYIPSEDDNGCPIFAVTSAIDAVGKSTVIANIALSFAQTGTKVLLIDADIRRPVINKFFNLEKGRRGLTELISGIEKDDSSVITQYEPVPSLYVLTSGFIPHNPSELISSKKLPEYLQKWRQEYDVILIDFPPLEIVSDALNVSNHVTGYIIVVRANRSDSRSVNRSIEKLEHVNAKIHGVILNGYSLKSDSSGRYGRYNRYGRYGRYGNRYSNRYIEESNKIYTHSKEENTETE